jgi:V8-like Glu-specific endopeptidase
MRTSRSNECRPLARRLLSVAVLALTVAIAASVASAGRAAPLAAPDAAAGTRVDDPCRSRPPTVLDRLPEWRCVGLATFHERGDEPEEPELSDEDRRRTREEDPRDEWGVAVAPDGRMYVQVAPTPGTQARESRPVNPDGREVDPERALSGYRLTPFTVLGADQRQIRLATTSYPWRALTAILNPGSTTSRCSGVLVGPRHVLTAGHCLYRNGAWFSNQKVAPGMSGVGNFPNGLKNHQWYYITQGWLNDEDPENDLGVLILEDKSSTANLGWFGTQVSDGASAWNFGYPGWWRTCAASPSPPQCSNFLYGMSGYADKESDWFLTYSIDTQPGQSGSPVYRWNNGDRRVIGVHAYGAGSSGVNWAKRLRGTTINTICSWINTWPSAYQADTCV